MITKERMKEKKSMEKEVKKVKRLALGLLLIGSISLLGANTASADYAGTLDTIFGDKISQKYNYAWDNTTLVTTVDQYGNTTYYSGGNQLETRDADGKLIADFQYVGSKLTEEWFGFSGSNHNTWYYTSGRRDYAQDWTGNQIADAVYWQDLLDDGYFLKTPADKETYLENLLGTVKDGDIDDMVAALDALYAAGVTDQNLAFMANYLKNSVPEDTPPAVGNVFTYQVTFYNEQGQPVRDISMQDRTETMADPIVMGAVKYEAATNSYYLEEEGGKRWYLAKGNSGRHDAGNFSVWLGDTEGGVARSLTVWEGGWVTIDSTEKAQELGYNDLEVMDLIAYLAAHVGETITLCGDAGAEMAGGQVLYVDGVWNK